MRYVVWVEMADGSGRITLTDTEDSSAASSLVGTLVSAASGVSLSAGVTVSNGGPAGTPRSTAPATPAAPARR